MSRTIDEGFRDFLTKLTPSEYESDAAKNHPYSTGSGLAQAAAAPAGRESEH